MRFGITIKPVSYTHLAQESGDFFGKIGSAVYHRQQNPINLQLGIDLSANLIDLSLIHI